MSLHDDLAEDLKQALKSKEQLRTDVIRMIKAAIQNKEIELKRDLDDAELTRVMTTLMKQRKDAAEQYQKANREDLATKELREIAIIEGYLPKALSEEEIVQVIQAVIQEAGAQSPKDMGPVMKAVMAKLAGQPVDGKRVSELVRTRLQQ